MSNLWIGVDLGGTKILAGLFDDHFRVLVAQGSDRRGTELDAVIAHPRRRGHPLGRSGADPATVRAWAWGSQVRSTRASAECVRPNLNWRDVELSKIVAPD